jgi:prophage regulatory protein
MSAEQAESLIFVRIKQVVTITNLPRSSIYNLVANDDFPKPVRISEYRSAWVKSEVEDWMRALMKARETDLPRGNPKRKKSEKRIVRKVRG